MRILPEISAAALLSLAAVACSGPVAEQAKSVRTPAAVAALASAKADFEVTGLSLAAARPGEEIEVSGKGFVDGMEAVVGTSAAVKLKVKSSTAASFIMPADVGTGATEVHFRALGASVGAVLALVSDSAADGLAVSTAPASSICSDVSFRDAKGVVVKGTRACAETLPDCQDDGQVDCRATSVAPAALKEGLAAKVLADHSVAGVAGTAPVAPAACSDDGASACVVDGVDFRAVKMANFDAASVVTGTTIAGVAGTAATTLAPCAADGAINCKAVANFPAVDKVNALQANAAAFRATVTVAGVTGTMAACAANGAQSCYVTGAYKALNPTAIDAAKMLATQTLLGVTGSVDLTNLTAANIKAATLINGVTGSYGAACTASGQQNCLASGAYTAASTCAANAANCYVPAYVASTQPLKAISYDALDASKMQTTLTVAGVTGTLNLTNLSAANVKDQVSIGGVTGSYGAACASNGQQNCLASGSYSAATACAANASNCYVPAYVASTQPLKAISYDAVDASKMQTTLTLAGVTGTINLTNLAAGNIKSGTAINGVTGSYGPACSANGQQSCLASGSYKALNPSAITASQMLSSLTLLGVTGTLTAPDPWDVRVGQSVVGVTGMLKVNCRNAGNQHYWGMKSSDLNNDGIPNIVGMNWLSTLDDYQDLRDFQALPPDYEVSDNYCQGLTTHHNDANVWLDVTSGGCGSGGVCVIKDKISALTWGPTQSAADWAAAMLYCQDLTYNSLTGWRLATQKELLDAYDHGLAGAAGATHSWIDPSVLLSDSLWSATTASTDYTAAWAVDLTAGGSILDLKSKTRAFACVR